MDYGKRVCQIVGTLSLVCLPSPHDFIRKHTNEMPKTVIFACFSVLCKSQKYTLLQHFFNSKV